MKKLQNVLYVTIEDGYLHVDGDTVSVKSGNETKGRFPGHILESIMCFGNTTVSSPLIAYCGERGISLGLYSEYGRFMGRVEGPTKGNVLLRTGQYEAAKDIERSTSLALPVILCKIANSRAVLLRAARDAGAGREQQAAVLQDISAKMAEVARQLHMNVSVETIRGAEGAAGHWYFSAFNCMIRHNPEFFRFNGRSRRPPLDPVNAILSFLYALLAHDYRSALEGVGLDPYVGFLHVLRPGRPALALDLMEELRAPLCDRLALSLINLRVLSDSEFTVSPTSVFLNDKGRKEVLNSWQKRKRESVTHEFLEDEVDIGLIPHLQSQLMARHLRGELDAYPPFIWR